MKGGGFADTRLWAMGDPSMAGAYVPESARPDGYGHPAMGTPGSIQAAQVVQNGAAVTLGFKAASKPADLLPVTSPQVALLTLARAEAEPAYLRALLSWPDAALVALDTALEKAAASAGLQGQRRTPAHQAIVNHMAQREAAEQRAAVLTYTVGAVAVAALGYAAWQWWK